MRKSHLLFLIAFLCLPLQVWGQITEGFEAGIPSTWTFSGPAGLDAVATASSGIPPTEGAQFAWISTGCFFPSGGTSCAGVGATAASYGSLYLGPGTNGLPLLQGLGTPTVETTLLSPVFSLAAGDTISFDANFVTTDGTFDFADFTVAQLIPTAPSGPAINLFVANTTCAICAAVPPVGLTNGVATLFPSTAFFAGLPIRLGSVAGTVNTNGTTAVAWVSGPQFPTDGGWTGTPITINGVTYTVSSVTTPTALVLTATAPTQAGVPYGHDTTYGSIPKFGGGNGGAAGWVHVRSSALAAGSYQLKFLVSHVGDTIYPSALAIDNVQTNSTFTTPPQPITQGQQNTVTFTDTPSPTNIQTVSIPADATLGGAVAMRVSFIDVSPAVFNPTIAAGTTGNSWSGGTPLPPFSTCTPLPINCIIREHLCFSDSAGTTPIVPCRITTGPSALIELTALYALAMPQANPFLGVADDGQPNYANITTLFKDCCTIGGGTKGIQLDQIIGSLGGSSPSVTSNICLLYDPTKSVKSGAVIPIKLFLGDASCSADFSSSGTVLHATGVALVSPAAPGVLEDAGNANPDNDFRFDSTLGTSGGYIFNLMTKGLGQGTWGLQFTVTIPGGAGPIPDMVQFQVQ